MKDREIEGTGKNEAEIRNRISVLKDILSEDRVEDVDIFKENTVVVVFSFTIEVNIGSNNSRISVDRFYDL